LGIEQEAILGRFQGIEIRFDLGDLLEKRRLQEQRLVAADLGPGECLQPSKTSAGCADLGDP